MPMGASQHYRLPRTEAELFAGLRAQERLSQVVSNPEEALQELAGG